MFKRLNRYIFTEFIVLFIATFLICSFVLLMQFLWKYLDDLVGKGIEISVLLEFLLYAFLSVVPLSLPLAVLLASLITYGNLAERFELLAMKAAGMSLFKIMQPVMVFLLLLSGGAFYFSNNILPKAQLNMWTLLYSIRFKSPEMQIPEASFYTGLNGYSIYVREKDNKNKLLYDVIIYDFTNGFNNVSIMLADTGKIEITEDKNNMVLTLMKGESFENLKRQAGMTGQSYPYRRESFDRKQLIRDDLNAGFNRLDNSVMKDDYMSKNMHQLSSTIDSINVILDSIYSDAYVGISEEIFLKKDSIAENVSLKYPNIKAFFEDLPSGKERQAIIYSTHRLKSVSHNFIQVKDNTGYRKYLIRRHNIEWHRKITLSIACFIFFFIGAPLGAIIKKGGLGTPVVVSVLFFIVYYMIDNTSYKMARDGVWDVVVGMWMSSFVLSMIGMVLTYISAKEISISSKLSYSEIKKKIKSIFAKKNKDDGEI